MKQTPCESAGYMSRYVMMPLDINLRDTEDSTGLVLHVIGFCTALGSVTQSHTFFKQHFSNIPELG